MMGDKRRYFYISILLFIYCFLPVNSVFAKLNLKPILSNLCLIIVFDKQKEPIRIGSGFPVGKNGEICTNFHIIKGAGNAIVKFVNSEKKYEAKGITHIDVAKDLAILKISTNTISLNMGDDLLTEIGDRIYAFGNPEGLEGTVSEGIISGFRRIKDNFRLIQITAPISPGSSGGPVVNLEGKVIGISSASIISGQNLNFAIPITELKTLLDKSARFLPFREIPENQDDLALNTQMKEPSDLVKVTNVKITGYYRDGNDGIITFSIRNNLHKDISDIRLIISWYSKSGEKLHTNPIIVRDRISSLQAKIIEKKEIPGVGLLYREYSKFSDDEIDSKVKILDYKIHKSSKVLEFQ